MADKLKLSKKSGNIVKDTMGDKVFYIERRTPQDEK
jgi:hypothetical protein